MIACRIFALGLGWGGLFQGDSRAWCHSSSLVSLPLDVVVRLWCISESLGELDNMKIPGLHPEILILNMRFITYSFNRGNPVSLVCGPVRGVAVNEEFGFTFIFLSIPISSSFPSNSPSLYPPLSFLSFTLVTHLTSYFQSNSLQTLGTHFTVWQLECKKDSISYNL